VIQFSFGSKLTCPFDLCTNRREEDDFGCKKSMQVLTNKLEAKDKTSTPCKEMKPEPMIVYQPAPRPYTHDEEVQTESPLIRFKEKERFLSGHGPLRVR